MAVGMVGVSQEEADAFAREWSGAWNSHNLDAILAHYHPDIAFTSPFVAQVLRARIGA